MLRTSFPSFFSSPSRCPRRPGCACYLGLKPLNRARYVKTVWGTTQVLGSAMAFVSPCPSLLPPQQEKRQITRHQAYIAYRIHSLIMD